MKVNWIEIDNIKSFKSATRISLNKDYNFVVGTNGSGKTTIFQLLSSCLLLIVPHYRPQPDNQSGTQKKTRFNNLPFNVTLPKHFLRVNDPQKLAIEISFEDSMDGFIKELEAYYKIFSEYSEYILENFWSQEDLIQRLNNIIGTLKNLTNLIFNFEFDVTEKSLNLNENSRLTNKGIIDALSLIEITRLVYNQLFTLGKTKEIIKKGFHVIYLGSDRSIGFPPEISINPNNIDTYLNNNSYSRSSDILTNIFSSNSFDYISQTLSRIGEQVMYRRWHLLEENPLNSINEFVELRTLVKDVLDLDFEAEVPGMPYETMKFYFKNAGYRISFDQLSSGEKSLVYFIFTLANPEIRNSFLIIDEAEIHLHGNMQDSLLEIIFEKQQYNNQHFISTHSPKLINKRSINFVLRFYKKDHATKYINFRTNTTPRSDYDIIRLINSQNNEKIFFADKVVLVEGIKDRILIEGIIREFNDSKDIIEIIDVGGKHNLAFYKSYLDEINVRNYTIADFDYFIDLDKKEITDLIEPKPVKIDEIIKSKKSEDRKFLINSIEGFIKDSNKEKLLGVIKYLKTRGVQLKSNLIDLEKQKLVDLLGKLNESDIFIISEGVIQKDTKYSGEIEDYLHSLGFPKDNGKSINALVEFTNKKDFIKKLVNKNDIKVILELFNFIACILYEDTDKRNELLEKMRKLRKLSRSK